jgi:catechol 2,3-dioxygenase
VATSSRTQASTPARLGDATRLGAVHLVVSDLDRSVAYYQAAIGLRLHHRDGSTAAMGAGEEDLVVLHERPGARPAGRHAGLYHYALLFPTREELARAAMRVAAARAPIEGASDHGTHEAIYLPDPDGNGIELAADRPREEWPGLSGADGYALGPAPLDLDGLLAAAGPESTGHAARGPRVGHVHLHVADLDAATRFYRDGLGFDVTMQMPSAVFLSAGGYHHHVAYNLWRGPGVPPAPPDSVGLRHWTLVLDGEAELEALHRRLTAIDASVEDRAEGTLARDPSGIAVLAVSRSAD